jgi:hypothetical protein
MNRSPPVPVCCIFVEPVSLLVEVKSGTGRPDSSQYAAKQREIIHILLTIA